MQKLKNLNLEMLVQEQTFLVYLGFFPINLIFARVMQKEMQPE